MAGFRDPRFLDRAVQKQNGQIGDRRGRAESRFLDEEKMRRAFHRGLGVSPQDYRSKFGSAEVSLTV
jgi:hypothetical protein